jgi:hypothetical protein
MADAIVLQPGSLSDFDLDELRDLVGRIQSAGVGDDLSIGIAEERGHGVLPEQILHVVLPMLEGYAAGKIIDAIIGWGRQVWRDSREASRASGDEPAAVVVDIIGQDGEVLRRVKMDLPEGEPQPYRGPLFPPGFRTGPPKWVAGPAAGGAQIQSQEPGARIHPQEFAVPDLQALVAELGAAGFQASWAGKGEQPPQAVAEEGGPPTYTLLRVVIDDPLSETEAIGAVMRWMPEKRFPRVGDAQAEISIMGTNGQVLHRLLIPPPL